MIAPRICTRLHGDKPVVALLVGDGPSGSGKVRIERSRMLVDIVHITAARIGLPDFHQRIWNRPLVLVEHMTMHNDALAQWFALVLFRKIRIAFLYGVVAIDRAGKLRQRMQHNDQRLRWRALDRAAIAGREVLGKST